MKKFILTASAVALIAAAPLMASAASTNKLQAEINMAAHITSAAIAFEQAHWKETGNIGTAWAATKYVTQNCAAAGRTCKTAVLTTGTGAIVFTFGDTTVSGLNKNLRGATITLTPRFETDANAFSAFSTRGGAATTGAAAQGETAIADYTCAIVLPAGSVSPFRYSSQGVTRNFIENSDAGKNVDGKPMANTFAKWCKVDSVTIAGG